MELKGVPGKSMVVQRNNVDGETYEQSLVDQGLFVCPKCHHAYIEECRVCDCDKPSKDEICAQWSEPFLIETSSRNAPEKPQKIGVVAFDGKEESLTGMFTVFRDERETSIYETESGASLSSPRAGCERTTRGSRYNKSLYTRDIRNDV